MDPVTVLQNRLDAVVKASGDYVDILSRSPAEKGASDALKSLRNDIRTSLDVMSAAVEELPSSEHAPEYVQGLPVLHCGTQLSSTILTTLFHP